jgi:hypothetical protein
MIASPDALSVGTQTGEASAMALPLSSGRDPPGHADPESTKTPNNDAAFGDATGRDPIAPASLAAARRAPDAFGHDCVA